MIDTEGRRLYNKITAVMVAEADEISPWLSLVMDEFNKYMNTLNKTKDVIYDKNGEVLIQC